MRRALVLLFLALPFFGCARIISHYIPESPRAQTAFLEIPYFEYRHEPISFELKPLPEKETSNYRRYFFSFPSYGENGQQNNTVSGEYFESKSPGKKKLVVVLPIYGTDIFPSEMTAKNLSEWNPAEDTNVLLLYGEGDFFNPPAIGEVQSENEFQKIFEFSTRQIRNTVIDIRRLIDWAENRIEIDSRRIGIVGFSISAFVASIAMSADQRIHAGAFVMGGANFHEIFLYGKMPDVPEARDKILTRFGWTFDVLRQKLKATMDPVNPLLYAPNLSSRPVLYVDFGHDEYIPKKTRDTYWKAMGRPERIILNYGHRMAFTTMTLFGLHYIDRTLARFFREKL